MEVKHHSCSQCSISLMFKRFVLISEQPICLPCYMKKFADKCEKCKAPIGVDCKELTYKRHHWHETCFLCCECQNSLANQQFVDINNILYCPDCYDNSFAQRCDVCTKPLKPGMQKFVYRKKNFCYECFSCNECSQPIGNNSFVPWHKSSRVCMPCYNNKFAEKCGTCGQSLLKGGVKFRKTAYHKKCFLCTCCSCELANVAFATKDNRPYCPNCFTRNFAEICEDCRKPISGLGRSIKYVELKGRFWHFDCAQKEFL